MIVTVVYYLYIVNVNVNITVPCIVLATTSQIVALSNYRASRKCTNATVSADVLVAQK